MFSFFSKKENLVQAAARGDLAQVKKLLKADVPVDATNKDGDTALHKAAYDGHVEVMRELLSKGAQVDAETNSGHTALHQAASFGNAEVVKALLSAGARIDTRALREAAASGNVEMVKLLLSKGAQVDVPDEEGYTALHTAAMGGHIEVMKTLLSKGAQVDVPDKEGYAALHTAAMAGHIEVMKTLLSKGAQTSLLPSRNYSHHIVDLLNQWDTQISLLPSCDYSQHVDLLNLWDTQTSLLPSSKYSQRVVDLLNQYDMQSSTQAAVTKQPATAAPLGSSGQSLYNVSPVYEPVSHPLKVSPVITKQSTASTAAVAGRRPPSAGTAAVITTSNSTAHSEIAKLVEELLSGMVSSIIEETKQAFCAQGLTSVAQAEKIIAYLRDDKYLIESWKLKPLPAKIVAEYFQKRQLQLLSTSSRQQSSGHAAVVLVMRLSDGKRSSGDSVVVDGRYFLLSSALDVKVKLSEKKDRLQQEYRILKALSDLHPAFFIHVYGCFDGAAIKPKEAGDRSQLMRCSALVMEKGSCDLREYLDVHASKLKYPTMMAHAHQLTQIIAAAHRQGYVMRDVKPSNFVLVNDHFKAIDFENCVEIDADLTNVTQFTPKYAAPELAPLLAANQARCKPPHLKALSSMDVFSLALVVWEIFNSNAGSRDRCFWSSLETSGDTKIPDLARLTNDSVKSAIDNTFRGNYLRPLRSWLLSAMNTDPTKRFRAQQLLDKHSLFGNDPTVDYSRLHVHMERIENKLSELKQATQEQFRQFGEAMEKAATTAVVRGEPDLCTKLEALQMALNEQSQALQQHHSIDSNVITKAIAEAVQAGLPSAIKAILPSSAGVLLDRDGELEEKMDMLAGMIADMKQKMLNMEQSIKQIKQLAAVQDFRGNKFPATFIIKPKAKTEKLSNTAPLVQQFKNLLTRAVLERVSGLIWEESMLVFVCPVLMKEVPCGVDSNKKGYPIKILKENMQAVLPALNFTLMFFKVALASQGLGAFIPNIDGVIPDLARDYLNYLAQDFLENISLTQDDALDNVDSALQMITQMDTSEALSIVQNVVRNAEGSVSSDARWEPRCTGLKKITCAATGQSAWVSEGIAAEKFRQLGNAAFGSDV